MKKITCCILVLTLLVCGSALGVSLDPNDLDEDTRCAASLFLSNFTEAYIDRISIDSEDMQLVDFAHDHLWFNDNDSFEYGEYSNDNNCRVSDEKIQSIVDKYFYDAHPVDLSQTRYDYEDGYYYCCETGGFVPGGYASVLYMCPAADENTYFISFMVVGNGMGWTNDDIKLTADESVAKYGDFIQYGSALVYSEDPSERGTYCLILLSML